AAPLIVLLSGADGCDQVVMVVDIGQIVLIAPFPAFLTRDGVLVDLTKTFSSGEGLRNVVLAARNLPAITRHMHAVRILKIDREVIVDVAIHRIGPHLAAAQT